MDVCQAVKKVYTAIELEEGVLVNEDPRNGGVAHNVSDETNFSEFSVRDGFA